jgi:anaphase-promoting complex subunit 4
MVGAESSKTVHQFSTGDEVSGITCVAWVSNSISKKHAPAGPKKGPESWQNFLGEAIVLSGKTTPLDLPRDLSLIDIETSLPKLSVLAAGGSS